MPVERTGQKVFARDLDDEDFDEIESLDEDEIAAPQSRTKSHSVTTPSGATLPLMTSAEAQRYNDLAQRYQKDNMFKNVADLLELDRLLTLEIMTFRWSNWILRGEDYDGEPVNASEIQKTIREYSKAIIEIKSTLAIDKKHRDAANGTTVAEYWRNLLRRGHEMGVHRDEQIIMAWNILNDIRAKITLHKNSTPTERTEFEVHAGQILEYIESLFPQLDELDEAFRKNQRIWIVEELQ